MLVELNNLLKYFYFFSDLSFSVYSRKKRCNATHHSVYLALLAGQYVTTNISYISLKLEYHRKYITIVSMWLISEYMSAPMPHTCRCEQ